MSNGVRIVPEHELAYCRERIIAWCSKPYPHMTLAQVQSLALLLAIERQKAVSALPRRQRHAAMPITLPATSEESANDVIEPKEEQKP